MASIIFPANPVDGQIYPSTPTEGQKVYSWSSTYQTWSLIGTATGVLEGTYGGPQKVGKFTVNIAGKVTHAEDVDIPAATEALAGIAEVATQAEVDAGTDDTRIVTPLKLANAPVAHIVSAPSASSDPGSLGQVAFGGGNFYYHDGSQWWQVPELGSKIRRASQKSSAKSSGSSFAKDPISSGGVAYPSAPLLLFADASVRA